VQSWEQGVRVPSKASRRLIQIFAEQPGVVCKVVGLRSVRLPGLKIVALGKGKRRIVAMDPQSMKQPKHGTLRSPCG